MSLTVGRIGNDTDGYADTLALAQECKVWAAIDGTGTVVLFASFNCSSVDDIAQGRYGINYTNNLRYDDNPWTQMGWEGGDSNTWRMYSTGTTNASGSDWMTGEMQKGTPNIFQDNDGDAIILGEVA